MEYDGLNRRIVKAIDNCADQNATYHYYYNGQLAISGAGGLAMSGVEWQLIETRNGSEGE